MRDKTSPFDIIYDGGIKTMKIASAVVLYNPDNNVVKNILSYVEKVHVLYVIDNSTNYNQLAISLLTNRKNIVYISMGGNKGIAKGLNKAARMALHDGYDFLMTMDQDSSFSDSVIENYLNISESIFLNDEKTALIGINHDGYHIRDKNSIYEETDEVITSGMILNLNIFKKVGAFKDFLFIDFVDYEYCYRVRYAGYKCIMVTCLKLTHQIGGVSPIKFMGIHFNNHNAHNYIRVYYIYRNAVYVMKNYPSCVCRWLPFYFKAWLKILCVENDKKRKIIYSLKGIKDGAFNKYGPLDLKRE